MAKDGSGVLGGGRLAVARWRRKMLGAGFVVAGVTVAGAAYALQTFYEPVWIIHNTNGGELRLGTYAGGPAVTLKKTTVLGDQTLEVVAPSGLYLNGGGTYGRIVMDQYGFTDISPNWDELSISRADGGGTSLHMTYDGWIELVGKPRST
jgi:hypothetical protein